MINWNKRYHYLGLFLLISFGCSDIIVPDDLEDETVALLAPDDNLSTGIQTTSFWWEELATAEAYNLQIVSPDFVNPSSLILDSSIVSNNFTYTLSEGDYQWRVIGINEAYESSFEVRNLTIRNDSTNDLSSQTVNLQLPSNGLCTNLNSQMFVWDELNGADHYVLQIGNEDFTNLILNTELVDNFIEYEVVDEGDYFWRVRAESQLSQTFTLWTTRTFTIDNTAPDAPVLQSPGDGVVLDYLNLDPDLTWSPSSDALADSLFIYADVLRDTLLFQVELTTTSFNLEDSSIDFSTIDFEEDYFWQLNSKDKSGNISDMSELRVFYIQE